MPDWKDLDKYAGTFLGGMMKGGWLGGAKALYNLPGPRPEVPEVPIQERYEDLLLEPVEVANPNEVEVAPGVSTVGGRKVPTPDQKPALSGKETRDLINEVRTMSSGLSEIRLPDGTTVKGITPDKMAQLVQPTEPQAVTADREVESYLQEKKAGDFLTQAGNFLSSPQFQYLAGRIAQAIVPQQWHGVNVAGGLGAELATNRVYDAYVKALSSGATPDMLEQDKSFNILPPELKSQALKDVLTTQREAVTRDYTRALTEESIGRRAGQLTREDILRNQAIDDAVRLKVAQIGDNNWMNVGQGYVFNIDTGQVVKAYDYQTGGSGIGNLNSSDYRLFNEYAVAPFIKLAEANKRREVVAQQGESAAQVVDLSRFFRNEDGSTNYHAVMNYLSDEQRGSFANALNQYTTNYVLGGVPPTTTFQAQQLGETGFKFITVNGERILVRQRPDGNWEEVK